jgi:hypothetical protein
MNEAAFAADDFVDWMIREFNFEKWEIVVLNEIRFLSFKVGRMAAPIHKQADLATLTGIPENKIAIPIQSLVAKGVLKITRPQKRKGPQKDARGNRYAIVTDQKFWNQILLKRRFEMTASIENLRSYLISLEPDDPDPKQLALPEPLGEEKNLAEALQETSVENLLENLPRHSAGGPDRTGVMPPDRSEPAADGQPGCAGDDGSRRGSADARSVPGYQASVEREFATPVHASNQPPLKGGSPDETMVEPTSLKGKLAVEDTASLEGSLVHKPAVNQAVEEPPLKGSPVKGGCTSLSLKAFEEVSSEKRVDRSLQDLETSREEVSKGETKAPVKGGSVLPTPRAPGAKVSYANEDEFMGERIKPLLGRDYENWGAWVRSRYRQDPETMIHAVDNVTLRAQNPKPVGSLGALLYWQFKRLNIAAEKLRAKTQA